MWLELFTSESYPSVISKIKVATEELELTDEELTVLEEEIAQTPKFAVKFTFAAGITREVEESVADPILAIASPVQELKH